MSSLAGCRTSEPNVPPPELEPQLIAQTSGTSALFIGIGVVDESTVWLGGTGGTWARTTNGGQTWETGVVAGADSLQFRDAHGVDARTAYLLSIGNGPQSRIYRTDDAGESWTLLFQNAESSAFFDCFDFWDPTSGIAFSDSFDGHFRIITTTDGRTWQPVSPDVLPPASPGEGAFAASGTCVVASGDSTAYIGTGAGDGAGRVLRTTDRGQTWSVVQTPIVRGSSAGIASLTLLGPERIAALGGDISLPDSLTDNVVLSDDGGVTWMAGARTPFPGAVYGSAAVPDAPSPSLVAVGPGGVALSTDGARAWILLDTLNHWSVAFASRDRGWAVGPGGRVTAIRLYRPN
jgi:photosystem II stability/assembly factor-like uncharacterized protein